MSTTPKFDNSDYLSDSSAVWKDKLKGQSTASASSSESTLSIPQSTQLSQDIIDLTCPYDSDEYGDEYGDEYLNSAPIHLMQMLLSLLLSPPLLLLHLILLALPLPCY